MIATVLIMLPIGCDPPYHVILYSAVGDPMTICSTIAVKTILNAHSTSVMAALGKVVGNTMTNVSPSNLKLIGRATNCILMHTQRRLEMLHAVYGRYNPSICRTVTYPEINAVLYDTIAKVEKGKSKSALVGASAAEVPLSIVRILAAADAYIAQCNPSHKGHIAGVSPAHLSTFEVALEYLKIHTLEEFLSQYPETQAQLEKVKNGAVDILHERSFGVVNSINEMLMCMDSGNQGRFGELFTSDAVLEVVATSKVCTGTTEIEGFCAFLHEKLKGFIHEESNIVLTQVSETEVKNYSYWKSMKDGEIRSYGTHEDTFVYSQERRSFLCSRRVIRHLFSKQ